MPDDNIASDYGKIMRLFGIGDRKNSRVKFYKILFNIKQIKDRYDKR